MGLKENEYQWNDLFRYRGRGLTSDGKQIGQLEALGNRSIFWEELHELGLDAMLDSPPKVFAPKDQQ